MGKISSGVTWSVRTYAGAWDGCYDAGAYQPRVLRVLAHPLSLSVKFLKCLNYDHVIGRYGE